MILKKNAKSLKFLPDFNHTLIHICTNFHASATKLTYILILSKLAVFTIFKFSATI
jgi:hypothetical protein